MMLAIDQSPPAYTAPAENQLARIYGELSTSQGDDGNIVAANLRNVVEHWFNRSEWIVGKAAGDEFDLAPVPLRIVGTMRVCYVEGGKIPPLPYPVDDE
ncbi:MAG: hypothetical protein K1X67_23785 [Fimbriimonadaceae bacterium]|nr:hypothetical protein [Fimbriimonadaceae bacterium]